MALEFTLNHDAPATAGSRLHRGRRLRRQDPDPGRAGPRRGQRRQLDALLERGDVSGKTGKTALLHDLPGVTAPRVLVIGLGDAAKFGVPQYLKAVGDAARALKTGPAANALFTLSEVAVKDRDAAWNIRQAVIAADHASYRYTATLGARTRRATNRPDDASRSAATTNTRWRRARPSPPASPSRANSATCRRTSATRPTSRAGAEIRRRTSTSAECEVLDATQMEELGMGSLLAVARGSANPPQLIVLKWNSGGDAKPLRAGRQGHHLRHRRHQPQDQGGIEEMKYDMCGAASVIGTFVAAVGMQLPINLVVVVPAVENMPDGNAYRPSDVSPPCPARPSKSATPTPKAA